MQHTPLANPTVPCRPDALVPSRDGSGCGSKGSGFGPLSEPVWLASPLSALRRAICGAVVGLAVLTGTAPASAAEFEILQENPVAADCRSYNARSWSGVTYWMRPDCDPASARQPGTGTPQRLRDAAEEFAWWFWNGSPSLGLDGALTLSDTHEGAGWHSLNQGRVVRLSGTIESGDADRLEQLFRENDLLHCFAANYCPFANVLSLDSPGGNLSEALSIARFVRDHQLTILLEDGAQCESACAFIFFAGYTEYEGYFHSRRYAHVSARLGVHRPDLKLPEGVFAAADVARIIDVTDAVKSEAVRQFLAARVAMPVLRQMYDTPPEAMYHLSVPELESLATVFQGPKATSAPSRPGVLTLCAGRYQALDGNVHPDLLANLDLRQDSFVTWIRHSDFACYGARLPDGSWLYGQCDSSATSCALTDCTNYFANPETACAPLLEAVDSLFTETIYNNDLGTALSEETGAMRHALVKTALEAHESGTLNEWDPRVVALPGWTAESPWPVAYCGALDFRDPAIAVQIQSALNRAGYDVGAEDGLLGPGSMAQIRQAGIDLLGRDLDKPDAALLQALGIGSPEGLLLCADAG
jgi:hypothetical protein